MWLLALKLLLKSEMFENVQLAAILSLYFQ
jgi:hypothetical protein